MPEMAELYSSNKRMLMVGRLSVVIEFYENLSPGLKRRRFILFDGKRHKGKAVDRLKNFIDRPHLDNIRKAAQKADDGR